MREYIRQRREHVARLAADGATVKDIAAQLGVSLGTVRSDLQSMGVSTRGRRLQKIRTLKLLGMKNSDIARETGASSQSVAMAVYHLRRRGALPPRKYAMAAEAAAALWREGITSKEASVRAGCSVAVATSALRNARNAGLVPPDARWRPAEKSMDRARAYADRLIAGETMQEIAESEGVTRQRIEQIVSQSGMARREHRWVRGRNYPSD